MNMKYTHGKLCVPNQKNLLELLFILAEKFNLWKEQYQHNNVVYSWVSSNIICVRSGTQTFLFLQSFSWRILYFYISAAPRAAGWMVLTCRAVVASLDLKRRWNKVAFLYSRVTNVPNPKPLALLNLLMVRDFWTMDTKVLLTLGTEMPWEMKGESSHLDKSKTPAGFTSLCFYVSFWDRNFLRKVTENPGKGFQPLTYLVYVYQPVLSLLTEPTFHNSTHNLRTFDIWTCDAP